MKKHLLTTTALLCIASLSSLVTAGSWFSKYTYSEKEAERNMREWKEQLVVLAAEFTLVQSTENKREAQRVALKISRLNNKILQYSQALRRHEEDFALKNRVESEPRYVTAYKQVIVFLKGE